ncbi:MAG: glycerophosphoryl diester phosphodiesterase membrane domain-containing protein [Thermomicrobiales bacterium]|nr:glycerophosphoryl diester phosphodiesterase membrane domain-containing protein [Thermomicrobiales bacterium]
MESSTLRRSLRLLAVVFAIVTFLSVGGASGSAQDSPEQQLIDRHAPIMMLRQQSADCDRSGEGYFPTTVDFLFDNPDIKLVANTGGAKKEDVVLQEGITPQDLARANAETYLDFPGNPRDPGCAYETYFKQKVEELGLEPTTYARIFIDPATKELFIQYWFYYYFNDWNNTHESDWEMIQVNFQGVTSAEEALQVEPTSVSFAQHGGGENSKWNDEKLLRDGDRPIVFASAGSHASYYGSHTFIGWGENGTAFGCDNTTPESVETPLNAILVPEVIDPDSEMAFLLYPGKWGEREVAMYSGPGGPNAGGKWRNPEGSLDTWRSNTLKVPSQSFGGVDSTRLFCGLSKWGSKLVTFMGTHPWAVGLSVLASLIVIGFLLYRVWAYFLEAIDIYGDELRTFLGIGALVIPLGFLGSLVSSYLARVPPFAWIGDPFNNSRAGSAAIALAVGSLTQVVMILVVTPAVIVAMRDIRNGIKPGVIESYKGAIKALPLTVPIVIVFVVLSFLVPLLWILLPVVVYLLIRWMFSFHAGIIDGYTPFNLAMKQSWAVTRGRWFRAVLGSLIFQVLAIIPGPLVGVLVMIVGGSRVGFANFLSSFVYALTIPLATIGITMLYHRMAGNEIVEPDIVTRERNPGAAAARAKRMGMELQSE